MRQVSFINIEFHLHKLSFAVLHYDSPTSRITEKLMKEYPSCLNIHEKVFWQHVDGGESKDLLINTSIPFTINIFGAPVEWWVRQNLDNFLTNVQVLSSFCPMFVQVLSMSNICQKNFNFTKFCQIIVHILSKNFSNRPSFV